MSSCIHFTNLKGKPRDPDVEPRTPDLQSISPPIPLESGYSGVEPNLPGLRDPPTELLPLCSPGFAQLSASRPTPAGRRGPYRLENRRNHLDSTINPHNEHRSPRSPTRRQPVSIRKPETTDFSHATPPPPATTCDSPPQLQDREADFQTWHVERGCRAEGLHTLCPAKPSNRS